jgi:TM2 domain-containing membrane protein YozV
LDDLDAHGGSLSGAWRILGRMTEQNQGLSGSQPQDPSTATGFTAPRPLPPVPQHDVPAYSPPAVGDPASTGAPAPTGTPLDLPPIQLPYDVPTGYQPPAAAPQSAASYQAPPHGQAASYRTPSFGETPSYQTPSFGETPSYQNPPYGQAAPGSAYGQPAYQNYGEPGPYGEPGQAVSPYQAAPYGVVVPVVPYGATAPRSKMAAGLLGIFLGAFGVHNFYLGFTGKAVAQLLITLLSLGILGIVSAIWGLVEGIMILTARPGTPNAFDAHGVPLTQ